jgi:hypothetical protein
MHRTPNPEAGAARVRTPAGAGKYGTMVAKQQHCTRLILHHNMTGRAPGVWAKKSPLRERAESILGGE